MKITIELNNEVYDYLKKQAQQINENIGAKIITAEDIAKAILAAIRDIDEEEEKEE